MSKLKLDTILEVVSIVILLCMIFFEYIVYAYCLFLVYFCYHLSKLQRPLAASARKCMQIIATNLPDDEIKECCISPAAQVEPFVRPFCTSWTAGRYMFISSM